MATKVRESIYIEAVENMMGFCTNCREFTREDTEPDAEEYDCPDCGDNTVVGAEDALLLGYITLTLDNDGEETGHLRAAQADTSEE